MVEGDCTTSIEKMRRKFLKYAEDNMEKAERYANKSEHSYAARSYEDAASNFEAASGLLLHDKALRLASKERVLLAEQYIKEKFKPNLVGFAYKSAYQDIEKLKNKADSDKEAVDRLKKLAEVHLKSAVSEQPFEPGKSAFVPGSNVTYEALKRATNDKAVKEEVDKKIIENTLAGLESNKNRAGIIAKFPVGGFVPGSDLRRQAIDKGIMSSSEFLTIYENTKKSIKHDEEFKAYGNAAYRSLNLASEASEKGYADIANEMASKAIGLYKKAEDQLKKDDTKGFCRVKEGEAKVHTFMGNNAEAQKAIQDAINAYDTEVQWYIKKKKWIEAQFDLENAQALAIKYGMHEIAEGLNKRIAELKRG